MIVTLKLFAMARDLAGASEIKLEVEDGVTIAQLREKLAVLRPQLASLLGRCALAMDDDFVSDRETIIDGCTVAVLPPVSGGRE